MGIRLLSLKFVSYQTLIMESIFGLSPVFFFQALIGFSFVVLGFFLGKYPPKKINHVYGYRTRGSMKSQERWDHAQVYSASEMVKQGWIMAVLGIILGAMTDFDELTSAAIFTILLLLCCIALVLRTERSLNNTFP
jgi:uncharacterized membrane protein